MHQVHLCQLESIHFMMRPKTLPSKLSVAPRDAIPIQTKKLFNTERFGTIFDYMSQYSFLIFRNLSNFCQHLSRNEKR